VTVIMFDSIDLSQFPPNPEAVAGYVGGHWPTYPELVKKFPHAYHLSIAVNASQSARCLDVEPGDATPGQAPGWYANHADHSQGLPVLYGSASAVQQIVNAMAGAGYSRDRYFIWSAHYSFQEHICSPSRCGYPQADATQWTDKAMGRNLDQSLCSDAFFSSAPAPGPRPPSPIPVPEDAVSIAATQNKDGRLEVFVQLSSGEVKHAYQKEAGGAWAGSAPGKPAEWYSMGNPGK
jgi:hypothetical protein